MEAKKYEEVKTTIGYDIPLSDDTYAKDKASVFISFTVGSEELDMDRYQEIADKKADYLAERVENILVNKGKKMIEKLVDSKVEAVRQEYESKLAKAREIIKKYKLNKK